MTAGNPQANLMAHAVLGAVIAQSQGNSALAGAVGASVGDLIARQLYPDKKTSELTEEERQVVSALSTLAGGLAGAIVGGSAADGIAGASTAQNAVNNNFLNQGRPDFYAERYAACKGESGCELAVRKDIAKESAANVEKLKACWDAGDTVCVSTMRAQIEDNQNAYVKLRLQDPLISDGYKEVASYYAEIVDNCAGKCGWLAAALEKNAADSVNLLVYAVLGGITPRSPPNVSSVSEGGAEGAGGTALPNSVPALGVLDDGVFAQVLAKSTKAFSEEGQSVYSKAAGRPINTVADLTAALKEGVIKPSQVPLDYVLIDGKEVIANTRSSTALIDAGIPKSEWYGVNKTGVNAYGEVTFDDLVKNQLNKNYGGSVQNARR